jgi:hypothetical protein
MSPIIHGRAFSQSNLDQRLLHSIGVISFYKALASTRIAAGLLFRASRPQLAKAVTIFLVAFAPRNDKNRYVFL